MPMRRLFSDMNPTARGFALIGLFSAVVVALQLESTLVAVSVVLQVLFLLAVAYFVWVVWRQNRHAISMWQPRARVAFYAAAVLLVVDIAAYWFDRPSGPDAVVFLLVLGIGAFSMWRVWRDQHTYS
jgi:small-conductance mechanosensitive channel